MYRRIKTTDDVDERGELLLQMVASYDEEYDPTDSTFTERFHHVVDEYHRAYLTMHQTALRVGRVLVAILDNHGEDVVAASDPADRSVAN